MMERRRWLALCTAAAGSLAAGCAQAATGTPGATGATGVTGGRLRATQGVVQERPAALPGTTAPAERLRVADLRRAVLMPADLPSAGLSLVDEIEDEPGAGSEAGDAWGRVGSYGVTYRAMGTTGEAGEIGTLEADGSEALAAGSGVTCSLNAYTDGVRASAAFASWRGLVPREYREVGFGNWTASGEGELVVLAHEGRSVAALVGFRSGALIGSVGVRPAGVGTGAGAEARGVDAAVTLAVRLAELVVGRVSRGQEGQEVGMEGRSTWVT